MALTSVPFFVCFAILFLALSFTTQRSRWFVLLVASYAFYATFRAPQLLLVLGLVTVVSYFGGIRLAATSDEARRQRILWASVIGCVAPMVIIRFVLPSLTGNREILVSLGVSYYSFQAISYLADVYLEVCQAEAHFGFHALSLAYFPKLLQGPIERAGSFVPQLKSQYVFNYESARAGLVLCAQGLFKKVVVADRLALFVDPVFEHVRDHSGLSLILGIYAYAFQIYFDFSGYTDIARGCARVLGVNLTENFDAPYLARSVAEFWRRWHISFSRWILDYIFKPLQNAFRDAGTTGTAGALLITFAISGLWHGASAGFFVWGLLHGTYLATAVVMTPVRKKLTKRMGLRDGFLWRAWDVVVTFHLVCLAWVFFRAQSLGDAWYILTHVFTVGQATQWPWVAGVWAIEKTKLGLLLFSMAAYYVCAVVLRTRDFYQAPRFVRWVAYYVLVFYILCFGLFDTGRFIYNQF